jgi:hypothetical protein
MLHIIFYLVAVKILAGAATCGLGEGRAGSSYELDAAQSVQSKFFFHILDILGGFLWKAEPSKFHFLLLVMKKDTYNDIFARRLLKTK